MIFQQKYFPLSLSNLNLNLLKNYVRGENKAN